MVQTQNSALYFIANNNVLMTRLVIKAKNINIKW